MTDILTSSERSALMSRIRGVDTKPEMFVRRTLHAMGYRFRTHVRELPGCPDLVLPKHRLVVFVHGCFWHQHGGCRYAYKPKSRIEFWTDKFARNVARDRRNEEALRDLGWRILVIWECETKDEEHVKQSLAKYIHRDNSDLSPETPRLPPSEK